MSQNGQTHLKTIAGNDQDYPSKRSKEFRLTPCTIRETRIGVSTARLKTFLEAYSGPYQTSLMAFFTKIVSSYLFERVVKTPLFFLLKSTLCGSTG